MCRLHSRMSTTTRNHFFALSLHRDASSNAPLMFLFILPVRPSKDMMDPLSPIRHWESLTWQPRTPCLASQSSPLAQAIFLHCTTPEAWHTQLLSQFLDTTVWPTLNANIVYKLQDPSLTESKSTKTNKKKKNAAVFYRQVFAIKHTTTLVQLHTLVAIEREARVTLAPFETGLVAGKRRQ